MKRIFIKLIIICLPVLSVFAQPANNFSPAVLVASGDEEIEKGQYYNALAQYEKAFKEVKDKDIQARIARTHLLLRDYSKAAVTYQKILLRDKTNKYLEDRFGYGRALKMNGNYEEAAKEFQTYIEKGGDPVLKARAENELKGIMLRADMKENLAIQIKNAGNNVNTPETQSSPALDKDGNLYYGSLPGADTKEKKGSQKNDKEEEEEEKKDKKKGDSDFSKLFSSSYSKEKGFAKGNELPELINREGYHTSNVSFSMDGNTMYFSRTVSDGGLMEESKIYASTRTASDWSPALEVIGVNGDFLSRHPLEGELFGSKVLYFAANIPGGKGGFDIYYAKKISDTEFEAPQNIGALNTDLDDITPYYVDGKLYFSSEGWPGIGGFDIFSSSWNGTDWSTPENMGLPINSSTDDLYYRIAENKEMGFLVSNRIAEGAKSLKSKTCCDDIYFVEKRKYSIELNNIVFDEAGKPIKGATAQLIEMVAGNDGPVQSKTNSEGNEIGYSLDKDKAYKIVVTKEGYFPEESSANTVGITEDQKLKRTYKLRKLPVESDVEIITINEPIRLNNIYYDFDDDKILLDAEKDLTVIKGLMDQYPDMVIELGSHTDSRGNDEYNQKLSYRRANSAKKWLVKKGVDINRIEAKGYGEEVILNNCSNGEECTDDEHRFNRRTEFKIIKGPTTIEIKKEVLSKKVKTPKK